MSNTSEPTKATVNMTQNKGLDSKRGWNQREVLELQLLLPIINTGDYQMRKWLGSVNWHYVFSVMRNSDPTANAKEKELQILILSRELEENEGI